MDFNAFALIEAALAEELAKQDFQPPKPLEDEAGQASIFLAAEVAYSLLYEQKRQRFVLRSTTLEVTGEPGEWRSLSVWLFDEEQGSRADAESIAADFLEVVRGPKNIVPTQQKRKRNKDEERTIDPVFFFNRLVNIFPEIRDELNEERILYGQVARPVAFVRENVVPKCENLAVQRPGSEPLKKLCELLDDMYKNGDMDLRSIITASLLNGLSDKAFETVQEGLGDELKKAGKFARRLKGRKIKPEKKKKEKKVVARLDDSH